MLKSGLPQHRQIFNHSGYSAGIIRLRAKFWRIAVYHLIYSRYLKDIKMTEQSQSLATLTPKLAIKKAWALRLPLFQRRDSDAFRIFHGFEEGIDGVIIEKFGDVAIIHFKRDISLLIDEIVSTLLTLHPFELIIAKAHSSLKMKMRQQISVV
ncbi:MAG: 23S rRNA G2069 N7-methylase RlmK/C1962 C5-methylase RlmI, partial [Paraglaciecola psychrophila]